METIDEIMDALSQRNLALEMFPPKRYGATQWSVILRRYEADDSPNVADVTVGQAHTLKRAIVEAIGCWDRNEARQSHARALVTSPGRGG